MPVLELRDISKSFGNTPALQGVDLCLERGSVHALIGENGAGKSTLMNVIAGAFRPDSGAISLKGRPYFPESTLDARRHGIALIHQELSLAPHLSVAENILMGMETARFGWLDRSALNRRADTVLQNFEHSDIRPDALVSKLSTAAQQVVEISRAIAANAEIVLMDEPTSSLQRSDVEHLFKLIRKLKADGVSIIYISHFLEEVREIADTFTILRDGRSVAHGVLADISDAYIVSQMVGRDVSDLFPRRTKPNASDPCIEVEDLSAPPDLKRASFSVRPGEILGIAGLMGAGRTKMARVLFGLDAASGGKIKIKGRPVATSALPAQRLRAGIGYVSEDRKTEGLAIDLSVADNATATRYSSCSRYGWLDRAKLRRVTRDLIKRLDVRARDPEQSVNTLSGGNQQKVAIARLVHQDADVLILDEPTRGIDIGSKAKIYETVAELSAQGKAIIMISSYLPELFGMCDQIAVMSRGILMSARPTSEWTPEQVMEAAIGTQANGN